MENFLLECWNKGKGENGQGRGSKSTVEQGKKYLNHILTTQGRPTVNKYTREHYAGVLDVLAGFRVEKDWREWVNQGAKPLSRKTVSELFKAPIVSEGHIDPEQLRNKILATTMIGCGFHFKDVNNMMDYHIVDDPNWEDRDKKHRPKFFFKDFPKTKEGHKLVSNTVGCGCVDDHDPNNSNCIYACFAIYQRIKQESDAAIKARRWRMAKVERAGHWDESGNWKEMNFFRSMRAGSLTPCRLKHCSRYGLEHVFGGTWTARWEAPTSGTCFASGSRRASTSRSRSTRICSPPTLH